MDQNNNWLEEFFGHARRNGLFAALRTCLRGILMKLRWWYLTKCWGMHIHPSAWISLKARIDRTNPRGIYIGEGTLVAFGAVILSHDYIRSIHDVKTVIGKSCLIGAHSFIMPNVTIGDHAIVGAMAVVTKNVPPGVVVAGNPAKIIKSGIMTGPLGKIINEA